MNLPQRRFSRGDKLPAIRPFEQVIDNPTSKAACPLGVAATAHPLATEAACEMIRAGGNAIDAAVGAAWALAVCEPGNSGLGGQTIMLLRLASQHDGRLESCRTAILDGHSRAPDAASLDTVSRTEQRMGYRATTVPTTPLVLETARQRHGRLSLAQVIDPAIRLAEEGFLLSSLHCQQLGWCLKSLQASPSANRFFLSGGQPYKVGQRFRQPELADTLRRIARNGVNDFFDGHTARQIADDMQRHGGLITLADLASIDRTTEREPLSTTYRGQTVATAPPPAGGLQIVLGLKLLECCDFGGGDLGYWYEMLGEATHAVFRERERAALSSHELTAAACDQLYESFRLAQGDEQSSRTAGWLLSEEPGETTHLCAADAEGNVVSLTQSIQSLFGARVACEACGFLYNNYLTTCPREPHLYQLGPRCRPRSNSAPTLVLGRAHSLFASVGGSLPKPLPLAERADYIDGTHAASATIALGAAGSRRTTSAILHTISGLLDRGLSLAEAVDAPRFHVKLSCGAWLERAPETEPLVRRLVARFGEVNLRSRHSYAMGCLQAIKIDRDSTMQGTADPRREGTAVVVQQHVKKHE